MTKVNVAIVYMISVWAGKLEMVSMREMIMFIMWRGSDIVACICVMIYSVKHLVILSPSHTLCDTLIY